MKNMLQDLSKNALNPDSPYAKVGAENPDVYFQGRESSNKYYDVLPDIVKKYMVEFKEKTGRDLIL
jgi:pyruvate-ferredoxin/flavodoxin oxidoreductase